MTHCSTELEDNLFSDLLWLWSATRCTHPSHMSFSESANTILYRHIKTLTSTTALLFTVPGPQQVLTESYEPPICRPRQVPEKEKEMDK
jgi:hypothetical protein